MTSKRNMFINMKMLYTVTLTYLRKTKYAYTKEAILNILIKKVTFVSI